MKMNTSVELAFLMVAWMAVFTISRGISKGFKFFAAKMSANSFISDNAKVTVYDRHGFKRSFYYDGGFIDLDSIGIMSAMHHFQ